ncbi:hypothetical protein CIHG_05359 [Coccidioides immitis H538.4]|uniref:Uncharacterized protein n=1 Tax=Coccidioides immitis H538.4 TaxID=396776 RepID=A0A0J8UL10_COCIT|nr:hypothetical protein CIHG_05359 [Coccidioides immitis H538.4]
MWNPKKMSLLTAGNYTVPICVHRVLRSRVAEEKEARMEKGNVTEDMLTINIRAGALAIPVVLSRNQSPRSYVTNGVVILILIHNTVEDVTLHVLRDHPVWVECANQPVLLVGVHALLAAKISILIHNTVEDVTLHVLRDHPVWVECANQPVLLVGVHALLAAKISILIHNTVEDVTLHVLRDHPVWVDRANQPVLLNAKSRDVLKAAAPAITWGRASKLPGTGKVLKSGYKAETPVISTDQEILRGSDEAAYTKRDWLIVGWVHGRGSIGESEAYSGRETSLKWPSVHRSSLKLSKTC